MFSMQNFEPDIAMISVSSNSALIKKYLRNTCLGQGVVPISQAFQAQSVWLFFHSRKRPPGPDYTLEDVNCAKKPQQPLHEMVHGPARVPL